LNQHCNPSNVCVKDIPTISLIIKPAGCEQ
jgi:hypothetical protein